MVKVLLQQAADQTFYFLKGIIISVYLIMPFLIKKNPDNNHQYKKMAVPPGVEPRLNEPKSLVLPLHHGTDSEKSRFLYNDGKSAFTSYKILHIF